MADEYTFKDLGFSPLLAKDDLVFGALDDLPAGESYNGTTDLVSDSVSPTDLLSGEFVEHLINAKDGHIRSADCNAYDDGTGYFLGWDPTLEDYVFFIGNSAGNKLTWDGTTLSITGALSASTIDIGDSDSTSFHVDADGNMWLGAATFATAPFTVANTGAMSIGGADASSFNVDISGNIWSGATTFAAAPFSVSNAGAIVGTSATISGSLASQTVFNAGEDLLQSDLVGITSTDNVKRHSPTALPTTFDQTATMTADTVYSNNIQHGILTKLTTSLYAFLLYDVDGGVFDPKIFKIPITPSTGAVGTLQTDGGVIGILGAGITSLDMVAAGTNKVLMCASTANNVRAVIEDLSGTPTSGTEVSVDTTNCDDAFCEYISDSHVLIFYRDTSAASIVFAKYTLSGTTLTLSSSGTVTTPVGTFTLRGVRRIESTDNFLLIIQNSTDGSAQAAVTNYSTESSTFTATGAWVNLPSDIDILATQGVNVVFASAYNGMGTRMFLSFATSTTNVATFLCTIGGNTPSFGAVMNTTRGVSAGYTLTQANGRCSFLCTMDGTTLTTKLLEIDTTDADFTTRVSSAITAIDNTLESDAIGAAFHVNPVRMGVIGFDGGNDDIEVGTGLYTLPPAIGIVKADASSGADVTVVVSGPIANMNLDTSAAKYHADIGGLLTEDTNGTPDKVGMTKSGDDLILKAW